MAGHDWAGLVDHVIRSGTEWLFRRKSPGLTIFRSGVVILVTTLASGWLLTLRVPVGDGQLDMELDSSGGLPPILGFAGFGVASLCITVGLVLEGMAWTSERRRLGRKRVLVIEQRGLRDFSDSPVADAVPVSLEGARDTILVDIRQRLEDGTIVSPEVALRRIEVLPQLLEQKRAGIDRSDISVVYGGLVPVPFAFLTGMLLDDEDRIVFLDWDRNAGRWRALDGMDDGDRFVLTGLDSISEGTSDVVLAVSASYQVDLPAVQRTLGPLPTVHLQLLNGHPDCHWSEEKQRALGQAFTATLVTLCNRQIGRVHLFIAAQNSVTVRLGRAFDKRNMPPATIYQYERTNVPPHPWGIRLPTHGIDMASVVRPPILAEA